MKATIKLPLAKIFVGLFLVIASSCKKDAVPQTTIDETATIATRKSTDAIGVSGLPDTDVRTYLSGISNALCGQATVYTP
ncbi:hypothetical protein NAF17_11080 [Mucilaginibacter sp. RB4R14]|uniref:hypothetical protein n=1 Tax=Mucilaginibacter aurantiaciroseus TaxID=2949308 RepID=UPI0020912184|nr:hypothetical protein [Mucilaginibacter aurantiaciroseus]MCO5936082.1 hypothetical protein [Mucilaginibacter aurantiaciroseus]